MGAPCSASAAVQPDVLVTAPTAVARSRRPAGPRKLPLRVPRDSPRRPRARLRQHALGNPPLRARRHNPPGTRTRARVVNVRSRRSTTLDRRDRRLPRRNGHHLHSRWKLHRRGSSPVSAAETPRIAALHVVSERAPYLGPPRKDSSPRAPREEERSSAAGGRVGSKTFWDRGSGARMNVGGLMCISRRFSAARRSRVVGVVAGESPPSALPAPTHPRSAAETLIRRPSRFSWTATIDIYAIGPENRDVSSG